MGAPVRPHRPHMPKSASVDTAPHQRLMCKLQRLAFAGNSVIWLSSLPTGRHDVSCAWRIQFDLTEGAQWNTTRISYKSTLIPVVCEWTTRLVYLYVCTITKSELVYQWMQKAVRKRSGFIKALVRKVVVTVLTREMQGHAHTESKQNILHRQKRLERLVHTGIEKL